MAMFTLSFFIDRPQQDVSDLLRPCQSLYLPQLDVTNIDIPIPAPKVWAVLREKTVTL